jgi:uncharacterized protein (DUF433 family)
MMEASKDPVIVRNSRILGGRPIFRGTRVQVETLFENLADGHSLEEILENFPTLNRADLQSALMQGCEALKQSAPAVEKEPRQQEDIPRARVSR